MSDLNFLDDDVSRKFWSTPQTNHNLFRPLPDEQPTSTYSNTPTAGSLTSSNIYKSSLINAPSYVPRTAATSNNDTLQEDYNKLKIDLMMKNQMIKNLTDQLNLMSKKQSNEDSVFKLPKNHYQLFQDLSKTLQDKISELEDTNKRLEVVLFAGSQAGQYDVQELSHKILTKLNKLEAENDSLMKMMSYGSRSSLLIEIGILKHEIEVMKSQLNN